MRDEFERALAKHRKDAEGRSYAAGMLAALAGGLAAAKLAAWPFFAGMTIAFGMLATRSIVEAERFADYLRRWDEGDR